MSGRALSTLRLLALPCALAALGLSCVVPNNNYSFTVVNPDARLGYVLIDGRQMQDVYSESLFAARAVTLDARLYPGQRSYFDGFDFAYKEDGPDGPFAHHDILRGSPLSFVPGPDRRFATVRFLWNSYKPEYFIAEDAVLYMDERGGRERLRLMNLKNGDRAGPSRVLLAGDLDTGLELKLRQGSSVVGLSAYVDGEGKTLLWSYRSSSASPLDLGRAMGIATSAYIPLGIGREGATAFYRSPDGGGAVLGLFDASNGSLALPALPRPAQGAYGFDTSADGEASLLTVGSRAYGIAHLVVDGVPFARDGPFFALYLVRGPGAKPGQVLPLLQYDSETGSIEVPGLIASDSAGSPIAVLDHFVGFSPDEAHLALFAPSVSMPGGITALTALDGDAAPAIAIRAVLGKTYTYFRWSDGGQSVEGSQDYYSWETIPGSERVLAAIAARDLLVSPSGSMRLDAVDTGGPVDLFLDPISSLPGSGSNLSLEDEGP